MAFGYQVLGFGSAPAATGPSVTLQGDIAVWFGGYTSGYTNVMEWFKISSSGNATDFGDCHTNITSQGACSNGPRGCSGGGMDGVSYLEVIEYITFASLADSQDFGDLSVDREAVEALSNGTRGCWAGGNNDPYGSMQNTIDFVVIASTGDATDFGNLTVARQRIGGCCDGTTGIWMGGMVQGATYTTTIDYITVASAADASDFGDITGSARGYGSSCSDLTKGLLMGGTTGIGGYASGAVDIIDYVNIASTGNASDFGNLTQDKQSGSAVSDNTKGVFGGGYTSSAANTDEIETVVIASTGNAVDFGDLTIAKRTTTATSGD